MGLLTEGYFSLFKNINKTKGTEDETQEGSVSALLPELTLEMDDEELIALKKQWEKTWEEYEKKIKNRQEENEKYWKGKHYPGVEGRDNERPMADNLIFEAVETAIPIYTRQKPEPVVFSNDTEEGRLLAERVRKMLLFLADTDQLKLKMERVTRYWMLYLLGAAKIGWSEKRNEISVKVLRPQRLILDKDATILEDGTYTGEYIGEYREDIASNLIKRFPEKESYIKEKVQGKMGTRVRYIEWWTDDYLFYTLDDEVLQKMKNPHWNYPTMQEQVDEMGEVTQVEVPGNNHFPFSQKPYIFLSVFNLGLHPHDDISVIEQNLALQDLVNKRLRQIDRNADAANGGLIVSGANSGLSKEQAADATEALRRGGTIFIPSGDVNQAVKREVGTPLPPFVYESLMDYRMELRNIFGVRASTGDAMVSTDTVRGKILAKSQDESRASLISQYLEQFADRVFNWMVQLMYVYYDEPHVASIIGSERAAEFIQLSQQDLAGTKLIVSVKEGSLIPKDPLTQRNEAVDLWSAGALDPLSLFERLDFPNPREAARKLFQWQSNPASLFPDMQTQAPGMLPMTPPEAVKSTEANGKVSPDVQMPTSIPQVQSDLANVPIQ